MRHPLAWVCALLIVASAFGQETKENAHPHYKLEFVLKQLEHGKVMSTHNYVMSAESNGPSSQIRTGDRVPLDIGGDKGIQYVDVGFNCDARVARPAVGNVVPLEVGWELSTMPANTGTERLIRQLRVRSTPTVAIGKASLVGSADDINSGQQFELEVTVTPEL